MKKDMDVISAVSPQPHAEGVQVCEAEPQIRVRDCIRGYLFIPISIIIICLLFTKVILLAFVPTPSMVPTLRKGDFIICNRLVSGESMERGTIIVFRSAELGMDLTKRVIGLPGETVTISEGKVSINGEVLNESDYLSEDIITAGDGQWIVPERCVFVMGDNREQSLDSRFWNSPFVSFDAVLGVRVITAHVPFLSAFLGDNPY